MWLPRKGGMLEFRILGPLQANGGQGWISIAAAKQRALLAMLLLNAGHLVRAERLIDELWDDRPPARPRVAVHTYVYRLRAMFKRVSMGDDGVALQTSGDGYRLSLPPGALDWDRWRRQVVEAQASLGAGQFQKAVGQMRQALRIWRGHALADVDTPAVRAQARGMDEQRSEVLEQCLAAELALGRHAAVLPELETLAGVSVDLCN
jgi:DNA-binding SARP family transcriptional activator